MRTNLGIFSLSAVLCLLCLTWSGSALADDTGLPEDTSAPQVDFQEEDSSAPELDNGEGGTGGDTGAVDDASGAEWGSGSDTGKDWDTGADTGANISQDGLDDDPPVAVAPPPAYDLGYLIDHSRDVAPCIAQPATDTCEDAGIALSDAELMMKNTFFEDSSYYPQYAELDARSTELIADIRSNRGDREAMLKELTSVEQQKYELRTDYNLEMESRTLNAIACYADACGHSDLNAEGVDDLIGWLANNEADIDSPPTQEELIVRYGLDQSSQAEEPVSSTEPVLEVERFDESDPAADAVQFAMPYYCISDTFGLCKDLKRSYQLAAAANQFCVDHGDGQGCITTEDDLQRAFQYSSYGFFPPMEDDLDVAIWKLRQKLDE